MKKNKKKYTLITGGTSGIGLELAKVFARHKHNIIVVARDESELLNAADLLRNINPDVDVTTIAYDLFEPENAFSLHSEVRDRGIEVEILVNDAGQGQYGEFKDTDIHRELRIINLNISSVVVLTKLFLQDMIESGGGRILNVSSIASKMPGPWQSVYHATKAFVQSFTEAVREEVKEHGVTITALLPGATATDFFNKAEMTESKLVKEGKLYDPADVAEDGYKALMNGDDKVISGLANKWEVAMANMTPESIVAAKTYKQQAPVEDEK